MLFALWFILRFPHHPKGKLMNAELLRTLVHYNPETGVMKWLPRTSDQIKNPSSLKSWNTRHAGKRLITLDGKGYHHFRYSDKYYRVHRMAWLYMTGELPTVIDHVNGIRTDNRMCNLKDTTQQGNHMNQRRNSRNTSGVTGVYKNVANSLWCAQMKFNGKTYHLGSSKSFFDAVCLRKSEERRLGFSHSHGVRT